MRKLSKNEKEDLEDLKSDFELAKEEWIAARKNMDFLQAKITQMEFGLAVGDQIRFPSGMRGEIVGFEGREALYSSFKKDGELSTGTHRLYAWDKWVKE